MTTSPFDRLTTTPEQPPGHPNFTPLFVSFSNKGVEISAHCSAACIGIPSSAIERITAGPITRCALWNATPRDRFRTSPFMTPSISIEIMSLPPTLATPNRFRFVPQNRSVQLLIETPEGQPAPWLGVAPTRRFLIARLNSSGHPAACPPEQLRFIECKTLSKANNYF